jgi:hypothetical protein
MTKMLINWSAGCCLHSELCTAYCDCANLRALRQQFKMTEMENSHLNAYYMRDGDTV